MAYFFNKIFPFFLAGTHISLRDWKTSIWTNASCSFYLLSTTCSLTRKGKTFIVNLFTYQKRSNPSLSIFSPAIKGQILHCQFVHLLYYHVFSLVIRLTLLQIKKSISAPISLHRSNKESLLTAHRLCSTREDPDVCMGNACFK